MALSRTSKAVFHLVMGFLLMLVYPVQPLFSGNQNVYFLWGMAKANVGSLALDPLLQQADPFPLFSFVIYGVFTFLQPWTVYLFYSFICSIYSYTIFGIADAMYGIYKRQLLPFTAFFLVLHSSELWGSFLRLLLNLDLRWVWDSGLAEQGVLRGYFQPSVFGIFLVLSVYRFLRNDARGAFLSLATAGIFHANYLFIGAIMGVVYFEHFVKKRNIRQTLLWSIVAISVTLPFLAYTVSQFLPSSSEQTSALNSAVRLTVTDNPHLDLSLWHNIKTFLQLLVFSFFLFLYRNTILGKLSLILFSVFSALSIIAFSTDSTMLLSLNPYRISVVLFPIASVLVLWRTLSSVNARRFHFSLIFALGVSAISLLTFRIFGRSDMQIYWQVITGSSIMIFLFIGFIVGKKDLFLKMKKPFYLLLTITCISTGVFGTFMEQRFRDGSPETEVRNFIKTNSNRTTLAVIPTDLTSFRSTTGCAIVADRNLVYGLSLSDQLARISEINNFYDSEWENEKQLIDLMEKYHATTLLVPAEKKFTSFYRLKRTYQDEHFSVLEL